MIKTPESELETYYQYVCTKTHAVYLAGNHHIILEGQVFWLKKDRQVDKLFILVVNEQDEPTVKLVRKS